MFLSDILGASEKYLDKKYLRLKAWEERWSKFKFSCERPPLRNIKLWWKVLRQLAPRVGVAGKLGPL